MRPGVEVGVPGGGGGQAAKSRPAKSWPVEKLAGGKYSAGCRAHPSAWPMTWTLTDSIETYAAAVTPLLSAEPERYTVLMGVMAELIEHGPNFYGADPPVLGWWSQGGAVSAAVLQTPPYPVQVTSLPAEAVGPLAAALAPGHAGGITGVLGGEPDATAFAQAWARAVGQRFGVEMRQRLYRLGELTPPDPMPEGAARVATPADAKVAYWLDEGFAAATGQRPAAAI